MEDRVHRSHSRTVKIVEESTAARTMSEMLRAIEKKQQSEVDNSCNWDDKAARGNSNGALEQEISTSNGYASIGNASLRTSSPRRASGRPQRSPAVTMVHSESPRTPQGEKSQAVDDAWWTEWAATSDEDDRSAHSKENVCDNEDVCTPVFMTRRKKDNALHDTMLFVEELRKRRRGHGECVLNAEPCEKAVALFGVEDECGATGGDVVDAQVSINQELSERGRDSDTSARARSMRSMRKQQLESRRRNQQHSTEESMVSAAQAWDDTCKEADDSGPHRAFCSKNNVHGSTSEGYREEEANLHTLEGTAIAQQGCAMAAGLVADDAKTDGGDEQPAPSLSVEPSAPESPVLSAHRPDSPLRRLKGRRINAISPENAAAYNDNSESVCDDSARTYASDRPVRGAGHRTPSPSHMHTATASPRDNPGAIQSVPDNPMHGSSWLAEIRRRLQDGSASSAPADRLATIRQRIQQDVRAAVAAKVKQSSAEPAKSENVVERGTRTVQQHKGDCNNGSLEAPNTTVCALPPMENGCIVGEVVERPTQKKLPVLCWNAPDVHTGAHVALLTTEDNTGESSSFRDEPKKVATRASEVTSPRSISSAEMVLKNTTSSFSHFPERKPDNACHSSPRCADTRTGAPLSSLITASRNIAMALEPAPPSAQKVPKTLSPTSILSSRCSTSAHEDTSTQRSSSFVSTASAENDHVPLQDEKSSGLRRRAHSTLLSSCSPIKCASAVSEMSAYKDVHEPFSSTITVNRNPRDPRTATKYEEADLLHGTCRDNTSERHIFPVSTAATQKSGCHTPGLKASTCLRASAACSTEGEHVSSDILPRPGKSQHSLPYHTTQATNAASHFVFNRAQQQQQQPGAQAPPPRVPRLQLNKHASVHGSEEKSTKKGDDRTSRGHAYWRLQYPSQCDLSALPPEEHRLVYSPRQLTASSSNVSSAVPAVTLVAPPHITVPTLPRHEPTQQLRALKRAWPPVRKDAMSLSTLSGVDSDNGAATYDAKQFWQPTLTRSQLRESQYGNACDSSPIESTFSTSERLRLRELQCNHASESPLKDSAISTSECIYLHELARNHTRESSSIESTCRPRGGMHLRELQCDHTRESPPMESTQPLRCDYARKLPPVGSSQQFQRICERESPPAGSIQHFQCDPTHELSSLGSTCSGSEHRARESSWQLRVAVDREQFTDAQKDLALAHLRQVIASQQDEIAHLRAARQAENNEAHLERMKSLFVNRNGLEAQKEAAGKTIAYAEEMRAVRVPTTAAAAQCEPCIVEANTQTTKHSTDADGRSGQWLRNTVKNLSVMEKQLIQVVSAKEGGRSTDLLLESLKTRPQLC